MNGRIYDPNLGRFMTADPTVQFASYSQSYNRYSYVLNNPLSLTDPTGFGLGEFAAAWDDMIRNPTEIEKSYYAVSKFPGMQDVSNFMMQNSWARALGHQAASSIPYAGWAVNAYLSGYDVWYQGGTHADIERAWVVSVGSAAASKYADEYVNADSSPFINALAHGAIGCAAADAGGGDCGRGAAQSFALTAARNYLPAAIAYLQTYQRKQYVGTVKWQSASVVLGQAVQSNNGYFRGINSFTVNVAGSQNAQIWQSICNVGCPLTTDDVGAASDAAFDFRWNSATPNAPAFRITENFFSGVWMGHYFGEFYGGQAITLYQFGIKAFKPGSSGISIDAWHWGLYGNGIGGEQDKPISYIKGLCGC